VIAALHDLVVEYPLVEPLEGLLMRALHAAGRDAEAVDRYAVIRRRLASELGTDPGAELRTLHQAILRGRMPPSRQPDPAATAGRTIASPAQLPPDVAGFTGRDDELRHLDRLLTVTGRPSTTVGASAGPTEEAPREKPTVVISAIGGTAGIGKTALAVHWAHRVADRFSDGQLYVNLRGFDPTGSPVTPAEAVRAFLDAFDVPSQRIPTSLEAQVGLYRSILARRRVLVLLDNARDAEQVRPLLPGGAGCLTVVTSRNQLSGLVASDGARPLTLDVLSAAEARDLLARRLGARRVAAEPHAADEIIASCARLPLALAIVAARAATHPEFSLAVLAGELRLARGGLDEFTNADLATDARAVFSWSYQQLSPPAARLFRLLGLHPGPDVATPAVASLAGVAVAQVRPALAELTRAHLIAEHTPGRYAFHDLLRAYASEQAHIIDPDAELRRAIHRMLDHYLHTAYTAARLLQPHRDPIAAPTPPQPGVTPETLADHGQALAWFTAERAILLAAVNLATGINLDTHTWQLAWTLADFLDRRGHWHECAATQHAALSAARRLADPSMQARAHRTLGRAYTQLNRLDDARTHLRHALDLYRQCDDQTGQARTHHNFALTSERQGHHTEALDHAQRALELFQTAGHRAGQGTCLAHIGWLHAQLGDHKQALTHGWKALALLQELGHRAGQAGTWNILGHAHRHLGHAAQAITCYEHALDLYQHLGARQGEAVTLTGLGDTHHAAGNRDEARAAWQHALVILDELGHPDADPIRSKLQELGQDRG
jgi:tetratricopeptide (TPR) repeat protein